MQHRENRSCSNAGADQDYRPGPRAQHKAPAWGGNLQQVVDTDVFVQIAASGALAFDADPVSALVSDVRQ
jgi:hypothetical protein